MINTHFRNFAPVKFPTNKQISDSTNQHSPSPMPHTLSPHPRINASPPIVQCSLSIVHSPSARHYNSALSIWLSVDPLADKYPGLSPYTYCADNPVKLVDPNGREIWIPPFVQRCADLLKNTYNQAVKDVRTKINAITDNVINYFIPATIHNTAEATTVYFLGEGEAMPLSQELGTTLMNTQKFKEHHQRIINGETTKMSGYFSVDMTHEKNAFFIGRTRVDYKITVSSDKKYCTVTYLLFVNDGYWDPIAIGESVGVGPRPDGKGPNREAHGGHPYSFKVQKRVITFNNPGYDETDN